MTVISPTTSFTRFLTSRVRLDPQETATARGSRDWLLDQITRIAADPAHPLPELHPDRVEYFGSFARRTKPRELDDIDLMVLLHARGSTHEHLGGNQYAVYPGGPLTQFSTDGRTLNSRVVVNTFVQALKGVHQYRSSMVNRRQQAAVLRLTTRPWAFDVVPGFMMEADDAGIHHYLIPDGQGHWMRTNPLIDKKRVSDVNQVHLGAVLDVVRLVKWWVKRRSGMKISSYLLEAILIQHFEIQPRRGTYRVDVEFSGALRAVSQAILYTVPDPKGIVPDINTVLLTDRMQYAQAFEAAHRKAEAALLAITPERARVAWGDLLGQDFLDA